MHSALSFNKFIAASIALHLALLGAATYFTGRKIEKTIEVEISFGSGNSRGGSGPKAIVAASPKKETVKKAEVKAALKKLKSASRVVTDAPKVVQKRDDPTQKPKEEFSDSSSTDAEAGSGLKTTSGSGSGTTSGSGAGFDDPKIRFRGLVYQLIESKKVYPRKAKALQQEGNVVLKVKIGKQGKLLKVEVLEKSPFSVLTDATLEAVKNVKFPEIPDEMGLNEVTYKFKFEYEIANGDF